MTSGLEAEKGGVGDVIVDPRETVLPVLIASVAEKDSTKESEAEKRKVDELIDGRIFVEIGKADSAAASLSQEHS